MTHDHLHVCDQVKVAVGQRPSGTRVAKRVLRLRTSIHVAGKHHTHLQAVHDTAVRLAESGGAGAVGRGWLELGGATVHHDVPRESNEQLLSGKAYN